MCGPSGQEMPKATAIQNSMFCSGATKQLEQVTNLQRKKLQSNIHQP